MKILQIAPCYVDIYNETGGVANVIRQICLSLQKNQKDTILICTTTELGSEVAIEDVIQYSDYLTVYVIKQNKNPLLGPKSNLLSILRKIEDVSLVHIHTCFSSITENSLNYFTKSNIKCIFTPHGKLSPSMYQTKFLFKELYFKLYIKDKLDKVSKIVTCSANEIDYVQKLGVKNDFSFIYNGYSFNDNTIKNDFILNDFSNNYLLFLGFLDPRKQPDLLIRAYAQSKAANKYKLILAGPDSYGFQNKLEQLSMSLNLKIGIDIIFTGRVTGSYKMKLLKDARALFLPSKGEGWPVVIAEAIGAETPCVISKECNFSEIVHLKLGIEISDFDVQNWANAIDEICFNNQIYSVFKERLKCEKDNFSWQSITEQWITTYNNVINETRIK